MPLNINHSERKVQNSTNNNVETTIYAHVEDLKNGTDDNDEVVKTIPSTPTQLRKVIEIQTVQTTCEKVSPPVNIKEQADKSRDAVRIPYLETCL